MLAPLLATEDPYAAASIFSQAGWKVEYESVRERSNPGRAFRWPVRGSNWSPRAIHTSSRVGSVLSS